jgi:dTDP-4-dehydrorhamnose reductase
MGRVALIGIGQLGSDILKAWAPSPWSQHELVCLTRADLDVTEAAQVRRVLKDVAPFCVINTAGFVRVDDCERQPEIAMAVNALGAKNVAEACRDLGAVLAQISTDYVFSGEQTWPYLEYELASPINAYGVSKRAGEAYVESILPDDSVIIRSAGLYGVAGSSGKGGNFVETMLRVFKAGSPLRVVDDQVTTPTFTGDLAAQLLRLLATGGRGIYHVTNAGECSWFRFASEIFAQLGVMPDITAITTEELALPARRPRYSVLANKRLAEHGIEQSRPWQEALRDYLRLKGHTS